MRALALLVCVTLLAVGCDEVPVEPDAGPPPDATPRRDAPLGPTPPAAVGPPRHACPAGWLDRTEGDGPTRCEPWPTGERPTCAFGERLAAGDPGCVPIGSACPSDDFPADTPASGVVYVKSGASAGDGSRAAPFGTIGEALAAAADGETVLVAAGEYSSALTVTRPVTIRGVCTATVLGPGASISLRADATVENLAFDRSARGVAVWSGDAVLRDLAMRDVGGLGIAVLGGSATVEDVSVRGAADVALKLDPGGSLSVRRMDIANARGNPVSISGAAEIDDLVVVQDSSFVDALVRFSTSTCDARLRRVVVESTTSGGLTATAGRISIEDFVLRGPPIESAVSGPGIFFHVGATVTLSRARILRPRVFGIAAGEGADVSLTDVSIEDVQPGVPEGGGYGLAAVDGATVRATRAWIQRAHAAGVLVSDEGTSLEVEDLTVLDSLPDAFGLVGRGVQVQEAATMTGTRVRVQGNHELSLASSNLAGVTLTDVAVLDTLPRTCAGCDGAGIGVAAYLSATLRLSRFSVRRAALVAVQVAEGGQLDLLDGEIAESPVGINVQVDGYDLSRVMDGVFYRDNGVNLDSTGLYVPDPTTPTLP